MRLHFRAWVCRANAPGAYSGGSPTQIRKSFLKTVGEGLKVNRPKAERSHPGVCPSRGPVWDRPLRKERTAINRPKAFTLGGRCRANARRMRGQVATHFVGADPCGRPWRSLHPVGREKVNCPARARETGLNHDSARRVHLRAGQCPAPTKKKGPFPNSPQGRLSAPPVPEIPSHVGRGLPDAPPQTIP